MDSGREPSRDRISSLPDEVLCHILSYLYTECMFRTSILSRRWRHLWASVRNLSFHEQKLYEQWLYEQKLCLYSSKRGNELDRAMSFINFVNRGLVFNNMSSIKKLHLSCGDHCKAYVHTWICAMIKRNVEELHLQLDMEQHVELPHMLFTCKTLVSLKLSGKIVIDIPISVCLPSLKILHLSWIEYMNNDTIQKLLSGCPVIEKLIIERRAKDTLWDFIVSSPTLKSLIIDFSGHHFNHSNNREYKLLINAPNLGYLKLTDFVSDAYIVDYFLDNLSSLSEVYIDVVPMNELQISRFHDAINRLLCGISNVRFLSLAEGFLWSLADIDYKLPTFYNVTHLTLSDFGWMMLADFLESSPNLQVLILKKECLDLDDEPHCWPLPEHVPTCLALHLKEIEIRKFRAEDYKLGAIRYMLENAKVLKKMTIKCRGLNLRRDYRVCHELTKFPRGSSRCQLSLLF